MPDSRVNKELSTALISDEAGLPFQLGPDSTPTSIAEVLSNHIFGPFPSLIGHQMMSTIFRLIESTVHSNSFASRVEEDLFKASKRQVLLLLRVLLELENRKVSAREAALRDIEKAKEEEVARVTASLKTLYEREMSQLEGLLRDNQV
ncbi:uncharacterized protein LOC110600998 [Manihot esculenta]|uniref:uncharacterized protein LOC110600998 n=1 Tax=Manihot esculenta TaxID=3983 RepID=UPI000B5D1848|nr:uncharacterized protein LOC110600998 [Manihot esculenta]XP_021593669.1 uncharacterized protein LOC110600998 [Manihot esculenta]